jgi:putative ABC transport system ATP-binding protein
VIGDIIHVENLIKDYRLGENIIHALQNINLTIRYGEFMSIMGPSGSGKTTLLNLIGALDRPTSGKVFLDGVDLTQVPEGKLYAIRRNKIGFIFQHFYLVSTLSALENVLVSACHSYKKQSAI